MMQRDGYIPGVPCWVDSSGPDPEVAVKFYGGLFGWEFENVMPPDADYPYYIARLHGGDVAAVGSQPDDGPPTAVWNTYVWVEDADETAAKVRAAGGHVLTEPFEVSDAGRMAVFGDPEGAVFCVWEARQHRGAKIVNEPGSLNFNGLHVRDVEAAKSFYGAVFGWEVLAMSPAAGAWRLPGYGDHLELRDPGLRERMAQAGAPDGFEDVVATLNPIGDDQRPHWSVTFAVDDADATAEKAAQLGGRVQAPPVDAPWVRTTVISDPRGATFIASQFVPENRDVAATAGRAT